MNKLLPMLMIAPLLLMAGCHHEHEEDDDFEIVEEIPSGGLDWGMFNHFEHDFNSADISDSGDKDGYEFNLAEDSVIITTTTGAAGLDTFLDLYADNFDFLAGNDQGGPGDDAIIVASLQAGAYFVVVGGVGSTTGDYDVDISVEPLGGSDFGELQPPDSVIDTGGAIDDSFDVDSYIFTVFTNVTGDIFVTTTSGSFDGNLELIDEYGGLILFNDPAGNADPDALNQALTPGTYIMRVGAASGSGSYDVQIDVN